MRRPTWLLVLLLLPILAACGSDPSASTLAPGRESTSTTSPSATPSATPSAAARARPVSKVLVVIEENHSLDQMRAGMPYTFGLAERFGYATHYTAIRHPSLPNYVAIAGGDTFGITDDAPPADHPIHAPSVFGRAIASGQTAALYAEGMPRRCAEDNGGLRYAVRHNPWAYFVDERTGCRRHDLPAARLGRAIRSGQLPDVGMVVPDLCNDAHDCGLSDADAWFRGVMQKVFSGPDWKSGRLAVVLTADEDEHDNQGNTVLTMVMHGSQHGRVVDAPLTHYSLSGLLSAVTGTQPLGEARTAPSMAAAFELPLVRG